MRRYVAHQIIHEYRQRKAAGATPRVLVGTDSLTRPLGKQYVHFFVTAAGLYQNSMEQQFMLLWHRKDHVPRAHIQTVVHRMVEETVRTLAVAEELAADIPRDRFVLDLDINDEAAHLSNAALTQCVAMCQGQGFPHVRWKPDAQITLAADRWTR